LGARGFRGEKTKIRKWLVTENRLEFVNCSKKGEVIGCKEENTGGGGDRRMQKGEGF